MSGEQFVRIATILVVGTAIGVLLFMNGPREAEQRRVQRLNRQVAHLRLRVNRLEQKLVTRSGALIGQLTLPEKKYDDHPTNHPSKMR